ncbi:EscD/YscD/HrpQ family type III secretion system periplasmic domain-containing protein [Bradyrhizobium sp. SSUT77]|uniref:SctD/MshK family protein n=1 Tax=Bradyrhizobium sp. SSUT77 TaxID=3040603 RepID=UPI00244D043A|nr:EscD/YscD/HrpQ family type III secretion system periplasmic domain-containing protein [Bradyrhizobium sp. SSUT77]MDH2345488.1 EscD/YscD/HrpQ family type III secretion system periplasmic domain-containing protein [Bradyrhizobium sp. SSUT77]
MHEPDCPHFEVLSGLYSGLTGKAGSGSSIIGSGFDADFVFIEQGLERQHLRITPHCDSIEIEALASQIRVEGHETISSNERVVVALPAVIHAGAMSIRWSMEGCKQAGSLDGWRVSIAALAIVLISSVAISTVSTLFVRTDTAAALSTDSPPAVEVAPKPAVSAPDALTTDAAAERLQEEVDRAGLLDIKVGSGPDVVTVHGTITPASVAKWQDVQQRFDHHSGGAYTLLNTVAVKQEKMPSAIAVQAVWRGKDPYLVIGDQKYFLGALLNNGWTVDRIEEGRVLLSRNGRLAALPY